MNKNRSWKWFKDLSDFLPPWGGITILLGLPFSFYGFTQYFNDGFIETFFRLLFYILLFGFYYSSVFTEMLVKDAKISKLQGIYEKSYWGGIVAKLFFYLTLFSIYSFFNGILLFFLNIDYYRTEITDEEFVAPAFGYYFVKFQSLAIVAIMSRAITGKNREYFKLSIKEPEE